MNQGWPCPQEAPSPPGKDTHISNHLPVFAFLWEAFPNSLNSDLRTSYQTLCWLAGNTAMSKLDKIPDLLEIPV